MSAEAARVPLTTADTRIHIPRRTARWDERPVATCQWPTYTAESVAAAI